MGMAGVYVKVINDIGVLIESTFDKMSRHCEFVECSDTHRGLYKDREICLYKGRQASHVCAREICPVLEFEDRRSVTILILSKREVERVSANIAVPHAIIGIDDPAEGPTDLAEFADDKYRKGLIRLQFYDIDMVSIRNAECRSDIEKNYKQGLFTDDQALQVVNFVDEVKGKIKVLICYCGAGISRSSGVGAAASLMINGSDKEIFNNNAYIPNIFVYRKILNAWQKRRHDNGTTA